MSQGREGGFENVQRHRSRFQKCPKTGKGAPKMSQGREGGSENVQRHGSRFQKCPKTGKGVPKMSKDKEGGSENVPGWRRKVLLSGWVHG